VSTHLGGSFDYVFIPYGLLLSLMRELVLYYPYLFIGKVKKSVQADVLGKKKLLSFIDNSFQPSLKIASYTK
jgi:hypothetical protein